MTAIEELVYALSSKMMDPLKKNYLLSLLQATQDNTVDQQNKQSAGMQKNPAVYVNPIVKLIRKDYGSIKKDFLDNLADLIGKKSTNPDQITFSEDDLVYSLQKASMKLKAVCSVVDNTINTMYRMHNHVNPEDVVHIRENFSGTRLIDQATAPSAAFKKYGAKNPVEAV